MFSSKPKEQADSANPDDKKWGELLLAAENPHQKEESKTCRDKDQTSTTKQVANQPGSQQLSDITSHSKEGVSRNTQSEAGKQVTTQASDNTKVQDNSVKSNPPSLFQGLPRVHTDWLAEKPAAERSESKSSYDTSKLFKNATTDTTKPSGSVTQATLGRGLFSRPAGDEQTKAEGGLFGPMAAKSTNTRGSVQQSTSGGLFNSQPSVNKGGLFDMNDASTTLGQGNASKTSARGLFDSSNDCSAANSILQYQTIVAAGGGLFSQSQKAATTDTPSQNRDVPKPNLLFGNSTTKDDEKNLSGTISTEPSQLAGNNTKLSQSSGLFGFLGEVSLSNKSQPDSKMSETWNKDDKKTGLSQEVTQLTERNSTQSLSTTNSGLFTTFGTKSTSIPVSSQPQSNVQPTPLLTKTSNTESEHDNASSVKKATIMEPEAQPKPVEYQLDELGSQIKQRAIKRDQLMEALKITQEESTVQIAKALDPSKMSPEDLRDALKDILTHEEIAKLKDAITEIQTKKVA